MFPHIRAYTYYTGTISFFSYFLIPKWISCPLVQNSCFCLYFLADSISGHLCTLSRLSSTFPVTPLPAIKGKSIPLRLVPAFNLLHNAADFVGIYLFQSRRLPSKTLTPDFQLHTLVRFTVPSLCVSPNSLPLKKFLRS